MSAFEILLVIIIVLFLISVYYTNYKSEKIYKKSKILASAIEQLNKDVFKVETKLKDIEYQISQNEQGSSINEDIVKEMIDSQVQDMAHEIVNSLGAIESSFKDFKVQNDKKIMTIEDNLRAISLPSSLSGGIDDTQVLSLYKQGMSVDTIAKELRLPKAEVEFSLKLNKMR